MLLPPECSPKVQLTIDSGLLDILTPSSKFQCWAADSDHKTVRVTTSISMTSAPFALQHTDVPAAYCADRNSNERADATKDGPGTTARVMPGQASWIPCPLFRRSL